MQNFTIEDYKKAIKVQYEIEKEKTNFTFLENPSQGRLRDLCWEKFEATTNQNDLKVFNDFFGFQFDPTKRNAFKGQKDKFRPIVNFLKGKSDLAHIEAADLAAILLDFHHRPFKKFRKTDHTEEEQKLMDELKDNKVSETKDFSNELIEKEEAEGLIDSSKKFDDNESETIEKQEIIVKQTPILIKEFADIEKKTNKWNYAAIATFLVLLVIIILLALPKKGCMQWSENHYELVYCDKPIEGNLNEIIQKDESLLKLKKVTVCDSTTFFKPDGQAIIWYAKKDKKVDFFNSNGNGFHPENKSTMRPVTSHILREYVYGKGIKCK